MHALGKEKGLRQKVEKRGEKRPRVGAPGWKQHINKACLPAQRSKHAYPYMLAGWGGDARREEPGQHPTLTPCRT